ncbi:MAG: hypothetical protein HY757_03090 [Nitrospirae bacterium]|nr:hypothetical protein [Nitrospirota bacterium]
MGTKKYVHAIGVNAKLCNKCHAIIKEGEHRFKEIPPDVRPLCAQCHSEELPPPADIKGTPPKVISKDEEIKFHAPFAEGKCTECHDAHESDFYKHLKLQYPENFYASFSVEIYSLCYKCHKEMNETLTEPRTLTATRFRNGNLNLHVRHVNKEKGRTCRACHLHHGSKGPALMRETFPFGSRMLTIKYEKTDTGGSCGPACHTQARYDRYAPVYSPIKTSPRPGEDATEEELGLSRERDMQKENEEKNSKNLKTISHEGEKR